MLLRDCPVGSEVRLVSLCGETDDIPKNLNGTFVVFECDGVNCIKDGRNNTRDDIYNDVEYQFEIVSQLITSHNHARKITLDGVTYKLTPITERKKIEIDGVVYEMEEQE